MSKNSNVGWTHHTFNPWWGCFENSPECARCYAKAFAKRTGHKVWGPHAPRRFFGETHWQEPLKLDRSARERGVVERMFVASMADVFEPRQDLNDSREQLWGVIQQTTNLRWLLLSKFPEMASYFIPFDLKNDPRIALGTTCGHPASLHKLDALVKAPVAHNFVSAEPLLGPRSFNPQILGPRIRLYRSDASLSFKPWLEHGWLDWIIIGGQTGPKVAPMELSAAHALAMEGVEAGVPVFVKQDSGPYPGRQGRLPPALWNLKQIPAALGGTE